MKKEKRELFIQFRVTETEDQLIRENATQHKMELSDFLRILGMSNISMRVEVLPRELHVSGAQLSKSSEGERKRASAG